MDTYPVDYIPDKRITKNGNLSIGGGRWLPIEWVMFPTFDDAVAHARRSSDNSDPSRLRIIAVKWDHKGPDWNVGMVWCNYRKNHWFIADLKTEEDAMLRAYREGKLERYYGD